jgi:DNA polymerase-3 subunit beta
MKTITMDAQFVRAAQACQAKNDVRYYLNGICIMPQGKIAGTNSHILYTGQYTNDPENMVDANVIISIFGNIPASSETVVFTFSDEKTGTCATDNKKLFLFEVIDGVYPDITKAIKPDSAYDSGDFSNGFGASSEYLAFMQKIFGRGAMVDIRHGTEMETMMIKMLKLGSGFSKSSRVYLMPCRVDGGIRTTAAE